RAPLWNQKSAGNFYGVSITHKQAHFVRAALEGITFNLYQIDEALTRLAGKSDTIYVNGGLARSPLWLQMIEDIFNKKYMWHKPTIAQHGGQLGPRLLQSESQTVMSK